MPSESVTTTTVGHAALNPIVSIPSFALSFSQAKADHRVRTNHSVPVSAKGIPPGISDNTNVFSVSSILTEEECESVRGHALPLLQPLDTLYAQSTRMADRAMIKSPSVAGQLYRRILPFLNRERDYADRTPLCFGHDGVWAPLGLNECLKVFRYSPGGQFVMHRDGPWVPRRDQCSMYTVIVYLNHGFKGGCTTVQGCNVPEGQGVYFPVPRLSITPMTGTALLMNHDCWHTGLPVAEGEKWILRTELIFQRVHSFYVDKNAFASDALYREARQLYDASMLASLTGDREAFFRQYQCVDGLQRDAMLRAASRRGNGGGLSRLNLDELSAVLAFLGGPSIRSLLCVSRRAYAAVVQCPFWQERWRREVTLGRPSAARLAEASIAGVVDGVGGGSAALASLLANRALLLALLGAGEGAVAEEGMDDGPSGFEALGGGGGVDGEGHYAGTPHADYFGRVRDYLWLRRQCAPAGLVLLDTGAKCVVQCPRPRGFAHVARCYRHSCRYRFVLLGWSQRADFKAAEVGDSFVGAPRDVKRGFSVGGCMPYYGEMSDDPYHMNRPAGEYIAMRACPESGGEGASDDDGVSGPILPVVDAVTGAVEWSVLAVPISATLEAMNSPLLVVSHPAWHSRGSSCLGEMMRGALDGLFHLSRIPAVGFCHPAVCAAVGYLAAYSAHCPVYALLGGGEDAGKGGPHILIEMLCGGDSIHYGSSSVRHYEPVDGNFIGSAGANTGTANAPPPPRLVSYCYRVNTATFAVDPLTVEEHRRQCQWGLGDGGAISTASMVNLRLVDLAAKLSVSVSSVEAWQGLNGRAGSGGDGTAAAAADDGGDEGEDAALFLGLKAARELAPRGTVVHPTSEVMGHGVMTLVACPGFTKGLIYRY